jgi:hypothetical protein
MAKSVEELDVYQKAMDASAHVSAIIQRDSFSVTRGCAISWARHQSASPP